jgi:hypothetical protein
VAPLRSDAAGMRVASRPAAAADRGLAQLREAEFEDLDELPARRGVDVSGLKFFASKRFGAPGRRHRSPVAHAHAPRPRARGGRDGSETRDARREAGDARRETRDDEGREAGGGKMEDGGREREGGGGRTGIVQSAASSAFMTSWPICGT